MSLTLCRRFNATSTQTPTAHLKFKVGVDELTQKIIDSLPICRLLTNRNLCFFLSTSRIHGVSRKLSCRETVRVYPARSTDRELPMLLRDHPLMMYNGTRSWPPVWVWRGGNVTTNPKGEVGILRDAILSNIPPNSTCLLIMEYLGAE